MAQNEEDTTCKICSHTQPTLKHWSLTTNIVTFCVAWIPNFLMHYPLTIFSTGFAPCLQSLLVATPSLSTTLHLSSSHASLVVSCPVPLLHLLGAVCSTSQSSRNESTHPKTSLNSPAWIIPSCLWRLNDDFRKVVPGGWEKLWKAYRQLLHPSTITSPFLGKKDDDTNSPKRRPLTVPPSLCQAVSLWVPPSTTWWVSNHPGVNGIRKEDTEERCTVIMLIETRSFRVVHKERDAQEKGRNVIDCLVLAVLTEAGLGVNPSRGQWTGWSTAKFSRGLPTWLRLENMAYEDMLKQLGLFHLEKRRFLGNVIAAFSRDWI